MWSATTTTTDSARSAELTIGVAVGVGVALVGGRLPAIPHQRGWMQHGSRQLATLSLALAAFLAAGEAGGHAFVAAFIGGLAFGTALKADSAASVELTELAGGLLSLVL